MGRPEIAEFEALIRWGSVDAPRQQQLIEALQKHPQLAREADEHGVTLLMIAAGAANVAATELLCRLGSDTNAMSHAGETPLINVVRELDSEGRTSPDEMRARSRVIDHLTSNGADPNLLGYQGCSALHWAIIYGQVKIVDHLLRSGARPEIRLNDPPDDESAGELVSSRRFRGNELQRKLIADLIDAHRDREQGN